MTRTLYLWLLAVVLHGSAALTYAAAAVPELTANHPSRYIVQRGDTLWDISGRFLKQPWLWPSVWQVNPQIKNPHLIYPGDEVYLSYRDGRPIVSLRRRARPGHVRLSPSARVTSLVNEAIPTIPVDAIHQFLTRPRVVTDEEFSAAPYILSVGREALIGRPGNKVYVRGVNDDSVLRFSVYRRGKPYINPSDPDEILGYEALHVADAALDESGDPASLVLTRTFREVLVGDRLMASNDDARYQSYMPRSPERDLQGEIISVVDGVTQIGQYQTVVVNLGTRDGLAPGHVFAVYRRGDTIEDPLARDPLDIEFERRKREREARIEHDTPQAFLQGFGNAVEATSDFIEGEKRKWEIALTRRKPWAEVTLPDERAGTIMVYRSFDRLSYALVMDAKRAMHVNDKIQNP